MRRARSAIVIVVVVVAFRFRQNVFDERRRRERRIHRSRKQQEGGGNGGNGRLLSGGRGRGKIHEAAARKGSEKLRQHEIGLSQRQQRQQKQQPLPASKNNKFGQSQASRTSPNATPRALGAPHHKPQLNQQRRWCAIRKSCSTSDGCFRQPEPTAEERANRERTRAPANTPDEKKKKAPLSCADVCMKTYHTSNIVPAMRGASRRSLGSLSLGAVASTP